MASRSSSASSSIRSFPRSDQARQLVRNSEEKMQLSSVGGLTFSKPPSLPTRVILQGVFSMAAGVKSLNGLRISGPPLIQRVAIACHASTALSSLELDLSLRGPIV